MSSTVFNFSNLVQDVQNLIANQLSAKDRQNLAASEKKLYERLSPCTLWQIIEKLAICSIKNAGFDKNLASGLLEASRQISIFNQRLENFSITIPVMLFHKFPVKEIRLKIVDFQPDNRALLWYKLFVMEQKPMTIYEKIMKIYWRVCEWIIKTIHKCFSNTTNKSYYRRFFEKKIADRKKDELLVMTCTNPNEPSRKSYFILDQLCYVNWANPSVFVVDYPKFYRSDCMYRQRYLKITPQEFNQILTYAPKNEDEIKQELLKIQDFLLANPSEIEKVKIQNLIKEIGVEWLVSELLKEKNDVNLPHYLKASSIAN